MELSYLLMQSILSMAVMVLMGWAGVKSGVLKLEDSRVVAALSLYIVCPCMMLSAFQVEFSPQKLHGLLLALAAAILIHGVYILFTRLLAGPFGLDGVEKGSLVYSNSGNLIIPLVTSLLGKEYVLFTSPFLTVQIILSWTHCVKLVCPSARLDLWKILKNPNILATLAGMVLFFGQLRLPGVVASAVESVGACVGPLGMFSIGMLMAGADWGRVFRSRRNYAIVLGRLVLYPALFAVLVCLSRITFWMEGARQVLLVTMLAACAPVAVTISQMADLFGADSRKAGVLNVLSVVFSILTMPLLVMLYQTIC